MAKSFQQKWKAMTCPDCEGKGGCPFCSSTGKVYERMDDSMAKNVHDGVVI